MNQHNHRFFQNTECEYFPCHKTADAGSFNCLFCYCPLYTLGKDCGGKFKYTESGIKDCSDCLIPHSVNGYDFIINKFPKLSELAKG